MREVVKHPVQVEVGSYVESYVGTSTRNYLVYYVVLYVMFDSMD